MSNWNQQRQATRGKDGKYAKLPPCPRCGKCKTVEPCYIDGSKWEGEFICAACIEAESQGEKR